MEYRRGPYGQFLVETTEKKINKYATEIISSSLSDYFLPVYVTHSMVSDNAEIAYECTGLISMSSEKTVDDNRRQKYRKAAGDLFLSFIRCLDLLIPLTGLAWDPSMIFWDNDNNRIKMCMSPIIENETDLSLSSLGNGNLENFLKNSSFPDFLSAEEISSLIYAVSRNDESLFEATALKIKNEDTELILQTTEKEGTDYRNKIVLSVILIVLSVFSISSKQILLTISLLVLSVCVLLINVLDSDREKKQKKKVSGEVAREWKKILFEEKEDDTKTEINCLIISSRTTINGEMVNKAVYTCSATIGSDRFLSDIYINDQSLSPVHVEVTKSSNAYYLTDISTDNSTYIENRRLIPGQKYEIKNGQVLRCGNYDFDIKIGFS